MGVSARTVGRVLLAPVWILVLGLLTIAGGRVFAFDRTRAFMLADSYTLWIYLPAYAIAVAALAFRRWLLAIAAVVLVIAQLCWVLPPVFRTVGVSAAARRAPRLRIISANLNFDNRDQPPVLAELQRDDADVIVLEEVTPRWWASIEASGLLATHPHHIDVLHTDPGGMAILSRLPLGGVVVHDADGWPIITANVTIGGTVLHLAGVHLVAPLDTYPRNQLMQRDITAIVRGLGRPRIVAGDFNASPYNRWYDQLLGLGLRESHEAVGRPFATTWPNGQHHLPSLRLDHVFVDPPIVPLSAAEGRGTGSDHRPIIVNLAVPRAG